METSERLAPGSDSEEERLQRELLARREALNITDEQTFKKIPAMQQAANSRSDRNENDVQEREASSKRHEQWKALVRDSGSLYEKCTFDTFEAKTPYQRKVLLAVKEFAAEIRNRFERRESLLLYGPVGTGKDHLSMAVLRAAITENQTVRWLYVQDWFGDVRDAMDEETKEASMVSRLVRPDWLVLSDPIPPIEGLTKHQATMLYRVVNERYARRRPTITTLNVASDDEADAKLGTATWDRLCANAWKIFCNWDTHRKPIVEIRP